ncbi:MAG: phosphoribosylaminoimidazolesuccinocarboxamide synthase [Candidatus Woesearchaeota archaeon]
MDKPTLIHNVLSYFEIKRDPVSDEGDGRSTFSQISEQVVQSVYEHLSLVDLEHPIIEGESKKVFASSKLASRKIALVELKPTLYSFTHNRYGSVEGTDLVRMDFWNLFGTWLNTYSCNNYFFPQTSSGDNLTDHLLPNVPFLSNFLGRVDYQDRKFAVINFFDHLPPIEVIWKQYLVGTMKHNLKGVNLARTRYGGPIEYEGKFPKDFIRFDWRNSLPDKDECIPEGFADFYIDTNNARIVALAASRALNTFLGCRGYELVDLCYFMSEGGNQICSEVTPDGMRIRKNGNSFDKDLWRRGKDGDTLLRTWRELYQDLSTINLEEVIRDVPA